MKVILFCNMMDGWGDFGHVKGIVDALKMDSQTDCELVVVVKAMLEFQRELEAKFQMLQLCDYFVCQGYKNEARLINHCRQASQVFFISTPLGYGFDDCIKALQPEIPLKYIGEHESQLLWNSRIGVLMPSQTKIFHMGLSEGTVGIKIKNTIPSNNAITVIEKNDKKFLDRLLKATGSLNFEEMQKKNFLVPAYFGKTIDFLRFLLLIAVNEALPQDKDFAIYFSGNSELKRDLKLMVSWKVYYNQYCLFKTTNIRQIELVEADVDGVQVYQINPFGNKIIRIFSGFKINDESYEALYRLQPVLAGVSGDNTFELAISSDALPFFWSTHFYFKKNILIELLKITLDQLSQNNYSEELQNNFRLFFNPKNYKWTIETKPLASTLDDIYYEELNEFKSLDLLAMNEVWPKITSYLREHHNLYNNLNKIFFENLSDNIRKTNNEIKPTYFFGQRKLNQIVNPEEKLVKKSISRL